MGRKFL